MVLAQDDTDHTFRVGQQACQFEDTFAWHDDLVAIILLDRCAHGAQRQAVTVSGHSSQGVAGNLQQHTVEVVAHILLGHGETGALDQAAQLALFQVAGQRARAFFHGREVIGWQGRQGKAAAAGLDQQFLLVDLDIDQGVVWQAFANVHQLACRDSDFARLGRLFQLHAAYQFDFQVGTSQRQLLALHDQQYVGQDRQGLAALDDTGDQLQGFQQGFALNGEMHGLVPCLQLAAQTAIRSSASAAGSCSPRGCPRRIPSVR
ncbi:hypothetical protein D3C78_617750 [compost metagenome]